MVKLGGLDLGANEIRGRVEHGGKQMSWKGQTRGVRGQEPAIVESHTGIVDILYPPCNF